MAQVNRKGERPVASPALEDALRRSHAEKRKPTERDRPPVSTFPGSPVPVIPGQLSL
jgi:hypothetical protein